MKMPFFEPTTPAGKTLANLTKPDKLLIVIFVLTSVASSGFDGVSIGMLVPLLGNMLDVNDYDNLPRLLKPIASLLSEMPTENRLLYSVSFVVGAVIMKNMFLAFSIYVGYWISERAIMRLRSQVSGILLSTDIDFFHRNKAGHLVDKVVTQTSHVGMLLKSFADLAVNSATFLILVSLLVVFSWQLTLVTLAFAGLISIGVSFYIRTLAGMGEKNRNSFENLNGTLLETIAGIQVIKSFGKEANQHALLKTTINETAKTTHRVLFGNYLVFILVEGLGIVAVGILFFMAITWYGTQDNIWLTQLLPFLYILIRLIPALRAINHNKGIISSKWPFLDSVADLLRTDNKPFIKDGDRVFTGLQRGISFENVTFSYNKDGGPIVEDLSFFIPQRSTTAIVGKSGVGKSTIASLLLRFYDPQKGRILVDDQPLQALQIVSFRHKISIVSQDTFIFNDTVANNIAFGTEDTPSQSECEDAARRAGAHEFITELSEGYNTQLGDRGVNLSGGQRQRLSIARAILRDPEILILDEATSSLDTRTEQLIHQAIADFGSTRTVIIIAHRLSTIKEADQILVMDEGKVVERGVEEELLQLKGVYHNLATGQFSNGLPASPAPTE